MSKEERFLKEYMNYTDRDLEYRPKIGYWKVLEAMEAYADKGKKGFKYCPYCGTKLQHKVETDANTPLECKSCLCKLTLNK